VLFILSCRLSKPIYSSHHTSPTMRLVVRDDSSSASSYVAEYIISKPTMSPTLPLTSTY